MRVRRANECADVALLWSERTSQIDNNKLGIGGAAINNVYF